MLEARLRDLADRYLRPLLSGSTIAPASVVATRSHSNVGFIDPRTIAFRVSREDPYRLLIRRVQKFDELSATGVTEKTLVEAFVSVLRDIEDGLERPYADDLLQTFSRRTVARALDGNTPERVVLDTIDVLGSWATRLYEGSAISAAIGIDPDIQGTSVHLREVAAEDFGAVLSNGFDTMLILDSTGAVAGHKCLDPDAVASFAPYRQSAVSEWASEGRLALCLNRLGEIMIFKDQSLLFARRSSQWHFLTHRPVITQLEKPRHRPDIRTAVYESCLDASFARTGACLGVVSTDNLNSWKTAVPRIEDRLDENASAKASTIRQLTQGLPFHMIDRRLRQELLAIDGATLIDYEGNLLAVGAILQIPGGSSGGGRRAAARRLGELGVGIKVSQDGGISAFVGSTNEPKVIVM